MRQQLGASPTRTLDGVTKTYIDTGLAECLQITNNLSDVNNAATSRTHLGLGTAAVMTGPSGAIVGISDAQTLTNKTIAYASNTITGLPYDLSMVVFGASTTRVAGSSGDNPMGIRLQRACTLTSITYRVNTQDSSGSSSFPTTGQLLRNGSVVSAATGTWQWNTAGTTVTFSQACSVGDIITINLNVIGTSPGTGLVVDVTGSF